MPKAKAAAPEAPAVEPIEQSAAEQPAEQLAEPEAPATEVTEQPAPDSEEQQAAAPEAPAVVKVRILANCEHGAPNDVVELPAAEVKALAGIVDPDPAAVAYAESLK